MSKRRTASSLALPTLALLTTVVAACGRRGRASEPAPMPAPTAPMPAPTAPMPTPAVAPSPATGGDPVAQQRAQVISLLDQIEALLIECEANHMVHVEAQAARIQELVAQMARPVAAFPGAAEPYAQLQVHAQRFTEACRHGSHHDMHEHHAHLRRSAAGVRAEL